MWVTSSSFWPSPCWLIDAVCLRARRACNAPTPTPRRSKLTKPVWLLILGGAGAFALLTSLAGVSVFAVAIAAVATGVYLVDVRPKILEIQGKSR